MSNPYKGLADHCFWARAMLAPAPGQIDPVVNSRIISPVQKVATMGSCFAQHLAKYIQASGLNYYIAETSPSGMSVQEAKDRNYGIFSARYGNIYTVRQALQLFDRAFGSFVPLDDVWGKEGGFVDAFRPQVEPVPFVSAGEVRDSAKNHLQYVRDVFTQCDWLVFTLGLTEGWRSKQDGAIYPVAPGVSGGEFDSAKYDFVNFTAQEVQADLELLIKKLQEVNRKAHILLTVSPVPLIATYEARHVWVSTTYSKAALRVAADAAERQFENVIYFPSYEIITSPANDGKYYKDDLRQVTELGVKHVMRMFSKHFVLKRNQDLRGSEKMSEIVELKNSDDIVCDEEVIERALRLSGFWGAKIAFSGSCFNAWWFERNILICGCVAFP